MPSTSDSTDAAAATRAVLFGNTRFFWSLQRQITAAAPLFGQNINKAHQIWNPYIYIRRLDPLFLAKSEFIYD